MTNEDRRIVVLRAEGGVVLLGNFPGGDVNRQSRSRTQHIVLKSLHPGLSVLHRIEFDWLSRGKEMKFGIPLYKELPLGEDVLALDPDVMWGFHHEVFSDNDTAGLVASTMDSERTMRLHVITPHGPVTLPLRFWLLQDGRELRFVCDLSPSELP